MKLEINDEITEMSFLFTPEEIAHLEKMAKAENFESVEAYMKSKLTGIPKEEISLLKDLYLENHEVVEEREEYLETDEEDKPFVIIKKMRSIKAGASSDTTSPKECPNKGNVGDLKE